MGFAMLNPFYGYYAERFRASANYSKLPRR